MMTPATLSSSIQTTLVTGHLNERERERGRESERKRGERVTEIERERGGERDRERGRERERECYHHLI